MKKFMDSVEKKTMAYISLGGNMGGEPDRFAEALRRMDSWPGIRVSARSSLYRTEPQGDPDQPWFTNQVAALECGPALTPAGLLKSMLGLETELGRVRDPARRFGPRTIDLDLLVFGDIVCTEEGVSLPHPRMAGRAFVLVPLLEIAPALEVPGIGGVAECLARLSYTLEDDTLYQEEQDHNGKST